MKIIPLHFFEINVKKAGLFLIYFSFFYFPIFTCAFAVALETDFATAPLLYRTDGKRKKAVSAYAPHPAVSKNTVCCERKNLPRRL